VRRVALKRIVVKAASLHRVVLAARVRLVKTSSVGVSNAATVGTHRAGVTHGSSRSHTGTDTGSAGNTLVGSSETTVALHVSGSSSATLTVLMVVMSGASSGCGCTSSNASANSRAKSSGLGRLGLAQTAGLLIAGAHGAAGVGSTAVLVADTVAVLARSCSSAGASHSTSGKTLGGVANTTALAIVVTMAVNMHALVTFKLLILQLLPVRLGTTVELS